jgi:hypothetical protein
MHPVAILLMQRRDSELSTPALQHQERIIITSPRERKREASDTGRSFNSRNRQYRGEEMGI